MRHDNAVNSADPDVDWASDQAMQHRLRSRCTLSEIPAL